MVFNALQIHFGYIIQITRILMMWYGRATHCNSTAPVLDMERPKQVVSGHNKRAPNAFSFDSQWPEP